MIYLSIYLALPLAVIISDWGVDNTENGLYIYIVSLNKINTYYVV